MKLSRTQAYVLALMHILGPAELGPRLSPEPQWYVGVTRVQRSTINALRKRGLIEVRQDVRASTAHTVAVLTKLGAAIADHVALGAP